MVRGRRTRRAQCQGYNERRRRERRRERRRGRQRRATAGSSIRAHCHSPVRFVDLDKRPSRRGTQGILQRRGRIAIPQRRARQGSAHRARTPKGERQNQQSDERAYYYPQRNQLNHTFAPANWGHDNLDDAKEVYAAAPQDTTSR